MPIGCRRQPLQHEWSWNLAQEVSDLQAAYCEFLTAAEEELCEIHDIMRADEASKYKGRAKGFQLKRQTIEAVTRTKRFSSLLFQT